MRSPARLIAALVLAAMCLHVTWLRSAVERGSPKSVALEQIAGPSKTAARGWEVAGVWHYHTEPNLRFGGYSALLPLTSGRLRAWSDRGFVFTFTEPDQALERAIDRRVTRQQLAEPALYWKLWDIESVAQDPINGDYWLAFENGHAIHRFSYKSEPENWRSLADDVDWYANGGMEAMVRLQDGRFIIIPEGRKEALIFASDPVEASDYETIAFASPIDGYAVTDMAQLPDGRLLMLMRTTRWDFPPFAALIAIAELPQIGSASPWRAEVLLPFEGVLPQENYEGLGVREREDGRVDVWVISDDNLAAIQRTLLAKLIYDPSAP